MDYHRTMDKLSLATTGFFLGKSKCFNDSIESRTLRDHLDNTEIEFPKDIDKRFYEVRAKTLVGELVPAFRIANWKADTHPTVIYHHGAGEDPYDDTFNRIFPVQMLKFPVNFIVIRAPFAINIREYTRSVRKLENYVAMIAASVKLIESLIPMVRGFGSASVTVSGISLGGFVSNIHHTFYNSADWYKPCLAGTSLHETLLNSAYRQLVAPKALSNPEKIKGALDFETEFSRVDNSNVFPLLGSRDEVVILERQKKFYLEENLTVIPKGHVTGTLALRPLREHILKGII